MIKKIAATQAIAMALATTMFVALPLADAHAQGEQSTIEQILLRRGAGQNQSQNAEPAAADQAPVANPSAGSGDLQMEMSLDESLLTEAQSLPVEGGGQQKKSQAAIEQEVRQRAYDMASEGFLPLEREEIRELLERLKETQEAIQTPVGKQPDPTIHVETINLDPASQPPTVKLATGNVTSLTIFDSTGEPWPVQDLAFGGRFDIKTPEAGGHVVRITPLETYARGNLSIRLMDFKTPLSFILRAGDQDAVHYRFDAQVPEMGPYADIPPVMPGGLSMTAGDEQTIGFLTASTAITDGADELSVHGADGRTRAWRSGGSLFLRTPHKMLSPTWESSASSADGMTVYRLPDTPVVLLSDKGNILRVRLKDKEVSYGR